MAEREQDNSTYERDLQKRIALINWVLEIMKNSNFIGSKIRQRSYDDLLDALRLSLRGYNTS